MRAKPFAGEEHYKNNDNVVLRRKKEKYTYQGKVHTSTVEGTECPRSCEYKATAFFQPSIPSDTPATPDLSKSFPPKASRTSTGRDSHL